MNKYPMVLIEWLDSASLPGWRPMDNAKTHTLSDCVSIGFLINESEDSVLIAQSMDLSIEPDPNVTDCITIPRVCIKHISRLRKH